MHNEAQKFTRRAPNKHHSADSARGAETMAKPVANVIVFDHGQSVSSGSRMTRSKLVERLAADNPHLSRRDVERVVTTIFEQMTLALVQGGRVELRGFGNLSIRARPARVGRNPRTGDPVQVGAKAVPFFKSGKELRKRLNVGGDA